MPEWAWVVVAVALVLSAAFAVIRLRKGGTLHPAAEPPTHAESEHTLALPVNKDSPPTWKTFNPRPNRRSDLPFPTCDCHDKPLEPGRRILWWPLPPDKDGRIAVRVFCESAVEGMESGGQA